MSYHHFREGLGWVMLSAREVAGWGLILFGFFWFYLAFEMASELKPVNLCAFALIGVVVFRGGIHLLKVAVAAKICQRTQDQLYPVSPATPLERSAKR